MLICKDFNIVVSYDEAGTGLGIVLNDREDDKSSCGRIQIAAFEGVVTVECIRERS